MVGVGRLQTALAVRAAAAYENRVGRSMTWAVLGLALLGHVAGCRTSADRSEARSEAARLGRAIDQLRDADNDQKREWLERLEAEPCQELCALKQLCEGAYREHVAALDAIREVRVYGTSVGGAPPGQEEQLLIAAKLDEAERRLRTSREMSTRCVESQGAVKLRYKL